jgi:VWFA-related protein
MKPCRYCGRLVLAVCAITAFLVAAPQYSDSYADGQSQTLAPTVRVTSRLLQVSVVVRKKGQPVTGLTKDDFTLTDQGQPQKIEYFSEQTYNSSASAPPAAAAQKTVFSNRFDQQSKVPNSVTVILLDALNTPPQEMALARPEIVKFLQQLQPQDRVALYGLSTKLTVLHDFTNDTGSLLRTLDKSRLPNASQEAAADIAPTNTGDDTLDDFIDTANQRIADMQSINRAETTTNVIAWIANSLVNIPGRKNLVWVSAGFPFQVSGGPGAGVVSPANQANKPGPDEAEPYRRFVKEIESAAEAVNNANLAIYPVDVRGIIPSYGSSASVASPDLPKLKGSRDRPAVGTPSLPPSGNFDTMNELADRTGGIAFYNTNNIHGSIRQAIDDSRQCYVLGYYPADTQSDGKFHEIKLKVKGSGLDVRYRRGYVAAPDASTDPSRVQQTVQNALTSPFEDTQLGLTVEAHTGNAAGAPQLSAHVQLEGTQMRFQTVSDGWADNLQVVWVQFAADGKVLLAQGQVVGVGLSQQSYEQSQKPGVKVSRDLELPLKSETVKVRLIIVDVGSGAVGSVDIPLKAIGR